MKTLKDFNYKGQKVLARCDFNVSFDSKGEIADDFRIRQTLPTIEYLIKNGAKVILMSHLGKGETKSARKNELRNGKILKAKQSSLEPVAKRLTELLKKEIKFLDDCAGPKVEKETERMKEGEVILLENLRLHKGEKDNDGNFALKLAKLGDIYVNNAFSVCHRLHASVVGLPKYLPSAAGLLLEKEVKVLSKVMESPARPLVVIIGGVKISSKIGVIENFLKKADDILLGGEIANTILQAKGIIVGKPFPEPEVLEKIERIDLTSLKLHLPIDGVISLEDIKIGLEEKYLRTSAIGTVKKEEKAYDIGPETIKLFSQIIEGPQTSFWKGPLQYLKKNEATKTILWSGPLGMFENEKFEKGTKEIARKIIANRQAFKVAGGGDTVSALNKFGLSDKFDHVSTGGGAMLEFWAGKKLPGLEALK